MAFINDITVILPPESSRDTAIIAKVASWLQERLTLEGVRFNCSKSPALLVGHITLDELSETHVQEMTSTQLKVVGSGMPVVGVPIGTETSQRQSVAEVMCGNPSELLRALVYMGDAKAAFQIMRPSAVIRVILLLRTLPASATRDATEEYGARLSGH